MHDRRTASTTVSSKVIRYLLDRGHAQVEIARMMHVSEGFISLVKSRERSLTIDHFDLVASALSIPLGALLIAVTKPPANASKESLELFEVTARVIEKCDAARAAMRQEAAKSSRRSA